MRYFFRPSRIVAYFFVCFSLLGAHAALAQFPVGVLNGAAITISPKYPGPNEEVSATLTSSALDLDRATISWRVNGQEVLSGTGTKTFSFSTGSFGTATTLSAVVTPLQGGSVTTSISITPASVDLLWQAQSYTPPFYKGRALHATDGMVRLAAIPHFVTAGGTRLSSEELIYTWEDNGTVLGNNSGRGRDVVLVQGSRRFTPRRFEVTVESPDRTLIAHASAIIPPIEPIVLFYENHPTGGILYNKALVGAVQLTEEETTVVAEPYFFSVNSREDPGFRYEWQVENDTVNPQRTYQSMLTLRQEGGSGEANISIGIEHVEQLLQAAATAFTIQFGDTSAAQTGSL